MDICLKTGEVEALVAGGLSAEDKTRFESHVASCSDCRKAVDACARDKELAQGIQQAYEKIGVNDSDYTTFDPGSDERPDIADSIEGYEILHEIHRGGQGVVYKAVQLATKRTVALKVLLHGPYASARQLHRFEREIDLVASLQHPNIVTVYDSGLTQGRHYFAMEYIHGQSLDAFVSNAKLNIDATLRLFQKICSAVNYAHQHGVIHRDLKPGNIRVDADGEPHVLDFGLAKAAGSDLQGGVPVTVPGEFMGTLAYASPEQTKGDPSLVDIRTDVYSLGVILFEMLTGKYPYQVVGHMAEVLRNIAEAEPKRPSTIRRQINDEVETIVLHALAKEKERRYQSAETLARDVGRYLAGEPLDAKRDSTWYVLRKSLRRYRLVAGVVVAFGLILAGSTIALSIMYQSQSRARQEAETARSEEQKRADELEAVTDFQQSMLGEIDAGAMGRALYADLSGRVREALEAEGMSPEEAESTAAGFDQMLRRTNATDAALKLVDEQVLSRAARAIELDFSDQPLVRAALQQTVASTYRKIGRYSPAMPLQKAALRTRRVELGDDHPDTLASIDDMAYLLKEMGEFEDAHAHCREALEGRRRVLGEEHRDTLESINNIGNLLQAQGKLTEAEPFYREALEKKRVVLGDDDPDTLTSINNLGFLLQDQGRLAEAEPYHREALECRRRVLGDEHPRTLDSINSMGVLLQAQGKLAEAEPYYQEALKGFRRVLGEDHPRTLISINNIGALLRAQGKLGEAEPYWREALQRRRRVLGDEHPDTLTSMNNLGFLIQNQGRLAEAESYWREALQGRRRVLGDEHPSTLTSINNLGFLLQRQGKLAEAESYWREALEKKRVVLGEDHPGTLTSINNLGFLLQRQGRLAEAEPYFREALEGRRRVLGAEHPHTLGSIHNMGFLLRTQGRLAEAEPYHHEALEGRHRILGDDHPHTLISINNMGALLQAQGKLGEAEAYFRKALEGRRRVLGDDHRDTLGSMNGMAGLLLEQGNHAEAAALLVPAEAAVRQTFTGGNAPRLAGFLVALGRARVGLGFEPERFALAEDNLIEAHSIFVETRGATHKDTRGCVQGLVDLYDAWHAAEPNGGYDAKAANWRAKLADSTSKPASGQHSSATGTESVPWPNAGRLWRRPTRNGIHGSTGIYTAAGV